MASDKKLMHLLQNRLLWYYTDLKGKEAQELLMKRGSTGHFLVRNSSEPGRYTLCVRREKDVIMVKIYNEGECYRVYQKGRAEDDFSSLFDLLKHFTFDGEELVEANGNVIKLTFPLPTETRDRWYHGSLPQQEVEKMLRKAGGKNSFLIRDKMSALNQFVLCVLVDDDRVKNYVITCENNEYYLPSTEKITKHRDLNALVEHYKRHPIVDNENLTVYLGEPPIREPLSPSVIEKINTNRFPSGSGLGQEFEELQRLEGMSQANKSHGQKIENKERNRYKNILPYDHSRVVLRDADPNVPGDDYINANYIQCEGQNKGYIATQGCLSKTRQSFWRMIWQENIRIIVMVTDLVENGKNKCIRYWPKEKKTTESFDAFGYQLRVTLAEENTTNRDYIVRKFIVTRAEAHASQDEMVEVDSREIYQYQYTAWPDKSVPKKAESLLSFMLSIETQRAHERCTAPTVVHCSAGIGRTGTYIVIALIVAQLKRNLNSVINIKDAVLSVRQDRPGMVQTEIQYKFIHQAINDYKKSLPAPSQQSATADNQSHSGIISLVGLINATLSNLFNPNDASFLREALKHIHHKKIQ